MNRIFKHLKDIIQTRHIATAFVFILMLFTELAFGQYYGMQFNGHEFPLNQRSGLNLTPEGPIEIADNIDIEFYLRFDPGHESYYGYVFRLLIGEKNVDLIHSNILNNPNNFELIIGDRTSKIVFQVSPNDMTTKWLQLKFHLDFINGQITSYVKDVEITDKLEGFNRKDGVRLLFGANSTGKFTSTDVAPMIIRDVKLKVNNRLTYHWPLDETQGSITHSIPTGKNGIAVNPNWLLKQHNTWKNILSMSSSSSVKTAYDPINESLYFVSIDTVFIYHVANDSIYTIGHTAPNHFERASSIIFDTLSNKLWYYSIDNNYVAWFNTKTGKWSENNTGSYQRTDYWHHNRLITEDGSLITLGGYGHHSYRNTVLKWNQEKNRFDSIDYRGEFFPRYLSGSGINPVDKKLYMIGGYGSKSGKQSESPDYYHDVLSFSLNDSTFSKVLDVENFEKGFCFSNSVYFDHSNNLYGLYFNKFDFDNHLQLIRISMDQAEIVELGNPINYNFIDVRSYSDLVYSKSLDALLAISTYTTINSASISVNSIDFPPQVYLQPKERKVLSTSRIPNIILLVGLLILAMIAIILFRWKRLRPESLAKPDKLSDAQSPVKQKNSILLFGGFQVFDKLGNDITGQFTPLPKKLFLYILLHTLRNGKGVSSSELYDTFWFDKSIESARNNRSVHIVKLKSLLDTLASANITKDTGYWKFDFDSSLIYIDYYNFLQIIGRRKKLSKKDICTLLAIVEKKAFLNKTQEEWLDSFKAEVSNEIIDTFLDYISHSSDDPEFLLHLTNCIFVFDPISEEALKLQCKLLIVQGKHSLARSAYSKFTKDYKHLYDEEYKLSFNQLIGE